MTIKSWFGYRVERTRAEMESGVAKHKLIDTSGLRPPTPLPPEPPKIALHTSPSMRRNGVQMLEAWLLRVPLAAYIPHHDNFLNITGSVSNQFDDKFTIPGIRVRLSELPDVREQFNFGDIRTPDHRVVAHAEQRYGIWMIDTDLHFLTEGLIITPVKIAAVQLEGDVLTLLPDDDGSKWLQEYARYTPGVNAGKLRLHIDGVPISGGDAPLKIKDLNIAALRNEAELAARVVETDDPEEIRRLKYLGYIEADNNPTEGES